MGSTGSGKAMAHAKILRVVVASPSDVQEERDVLDKVVTEVNRGVAADRGIRLEVARWETDAYPGFHPDGPQGLIDPILRITDCDLLIGIFWKRFGTATSDAESGTEHEIHVAHEAWKRSGAPQIMIYFNEQSAFPGSSVGAVQWAHVLRFKENFPKEGLWWAYEGHTQFERLVRNHLTQYVRDRFSLLEDAAGRGTSADAAGHFTPSTHPAPNGCYARWEVFDFGSVADRWRGRLGRQDASCRKGYSLYRARQGSRGVRTPES